MQDEQTHVLIVDDERDIVFVLEQILEGFEVNVHPFTDPREALNYLGENPCLIKLLITDYRMPQMSGLEFIKAARGLGETMKIIVMSAFEPTKREMEAAKIELRIDNIISKPFGSEKMLVAVKEQLLKTI